MTREEAIERLGIHKSTDVWNDSIAEAIDMAIDALAVYPRFKWERDTAISQLEEYGIGFAEKKRDLVEVVRCKDCKWYGHLGCAIRIVDDSDKPNDNDFCSFGERREE